MAYRTPIRNRVKSKPTTQAFQVGLVPSFAGVGFDGCTKSMGNLGQHVRRRIMHGKVRTSLQLPFSPHYLFFAALSLKTLDFIFSAPEISPRLSLASLASASFGVQPVRVHLDHRQRHQGRRGGVRVSSHQLARQTRQAA